MLSQHHNAVRAETARCEGIEVDTAGDGFLTKGAGSRTAGLVMAFKLLLVAEGHWRSIDAPELVPLSVLA